MTVADRSGGFHRATAVETEQRLEALRFGQNLLRHLREALPKVWNFYDKAVEEGNAVLVIDLRARDLEIPDAVELAAL